MAALNSVPPPFPNSDVVPESPWIEMDQRDSVKAMDEYVKDMSAPMTETHLGGGEGREVKRHG